MLLVALSRSRSFRAAKTLPRLSSAGSSARSATPAPAPASSRQIHSGAPSSEKRLSRSTLFLLVGASLASFGAGVLLDRGYGSKPGISAEDKPRYGGPEERAAAIRALRKVFQDREDMVSTDASDLDNHASWLASHKPRTAHQVIVYAESTEDVVKAVEVANTYSIPVVPYSAGSSLEGQITGTEHGSICIDLSRMNKIIEIHEKDADVVAQAGVGWMALNEELQERGIPLFFPLDPGPNATLGGMFSTGCSGPNAVRYGTARGEWFLNATIVLPSGKVIKTRRRSRKSSAGWDVTKLFIGAEGTLGIVTELTVRLAPVIPTNVAIVAFPNIRSASDAAIELLNSGASLQCIELLDIHQMRAINAHLKPARPYTPADHLFLKLQGVTSHALADTAQLARAVTLKHGGTDWRVAHDADEARVMWNDRKLAAYASVMYGGEGAKVWPTDVCVPVSQLPQLVEDVRRDMDDKHVIGTIVGHAGDGNFHAAIAFKNAEEQKTVEGIVHRMNKRALALDGTCTGEHGVGIGKREYLNDELGVGTVEVMRQIKRTLDPRGLFNPGKMLPDDD